MGRIAGEFTKPSFASVEERAASVLPAYRGDIVNDTEFPDAHREATPNRMLRVYFQPSATLNFLRSLSSGGYANLENVNQWLLEFSEESPIGLEYQNIANSIQSTIEYMKENKAVYVRGKFSFPKLWIFTPATRLYCFRIKNPLFKADL